MPRSEQQAAPSDADVVRAVLDGRPDMYRHLVERYQDVLYRHAIRMAQRPDDASDLVQRAFVKGFRSLEDCRHPEKVGGWLFRITANLCKDYLKNRRRDEVGLDDAPTLVSERGDPALELDRSQLGADLRRALDALTGDQREAFVMKHVEDLSYEEMAERLEVSVPALKMRVHRAREQLRGLLSDYR
ncbi:MAG TPA: sigma-70 family RNA polymerase sigma factor [Gemmatimonadota bacterium]|nr:sigma-70 family RNA polymerase sigma factor [Gemmatimonadota bacterium]